MAATVSIITPAYKAGAFIARAIDSALSQDGVSCEILVIDDCCPEGTADAVEARYGDEARVRVLRLPENRGPSGARNAGLAAATGDWIAILDADDAFEPGRLARMVALGEEYEADVVADNVRYFDQESGRTSPPMITSIGEPTIIGLRDFIRGARPRTGELDFGLLKPMYRRAFLGGRFSYPAGVRHGEDFLFYVALLEAGARFVIDPQAGYLWTLRNSGFSQTAIDYGGMAERSLQMAEEYADRDPELKRLLEVRADSLMVFHRRDQMFAHRRKGEYWQFARIALSDPRLWPALRTSLTNKLAEIAKARRQRR